MRTHFVYSSDKSKTACNIKINNKDFIKYRHQWSPVNCQECLKVKIESDNPYFNLEKRTVFFTKCKVCGDIINQETNICPNCETIIIRRK